MSWWDEGNEVLGDGPVDAVKAAWRAVLARRAQAGQPRPTLEQTLDSFCGAMRALPGFGTAAIDVLSGRERVQRAGGALPVDDLRAGFATALAAVMQDYQQHQRRTATAMELVKTLDFIIGGDPQLYCSDLPANAWRQLRLRAASDEDGAA
jgi:hypothetical protein